MVSFFLSFSGICTVLVLVLLIFTAVANRSTKRTCEALASISAPAMKAKEIRIKALEKEIADKATEIRTIAEATTVIDLTGQENIEVEAPPRNPLSDTQLMKLIQKKVEYVRKKAAGE